MNAMSTTTEAVADLSAQAFWFVSGVVAGIDPGLQGAIALFEPATGWLEVTDMPIYARNGRNVVNGHAVADILTSCAVRFAVIEEPGVRPGQDVGRQARFHRGSGVIEGVVAAKCIPFKFVAASKWKAVVGLKGIGKDGSRDLASRLFPTYSGQFARKKDDGRAESAILAAYAARHGAQ